jgi:hypothetical protein
MVFLHAITGPPGSTLARSFQRAAGADGLRPLVGPFRESVARLSAPPALLEEGGATETGRNGAGTDPYCLRRVGVKDWDGPLSLLWKSLTGELVPPAWDRWTRWFRLVRLKMKR